MPYCQIRMQPKNCNPFEFKANTKNRFTEKSYKYYKRKDLEDVLIPYLEKGQEKAEEDRQVEADTSQSIHLSVLINRHRKYKGGKWWQKQLYDYFGEVTEEDIVSCRHNTTSEIMLSFDQIKERSKSYNQIITFSKYPQIAENDYIKILYHGIVEQSDD